jgi:hypothetical protein
MARTRRPWYRQGTGWWYVEIDGKQVKLARGRANRSEANARLREVMAEMDRATAAGATPTVRVLAQQHMIVHHRFCKFAAA